LGVAAVIGQFLQQLLGGLAQVGTGNAGAQKWCQTQVAVAALFAQDRLKIIHGVHGPVPLFGWQRPQMGAAVA
jgi:hypothetical protein